MSQLDNLITLVQSWDTRLDWDDFFMSISFLSASRSPCSRLHVGCVIVKNNRIISMGYNGFLPKAEHVSHVRNGHEQAINHAEANTVSDCANRGVSLNDSIAYITHFPCINCFKLLVSSGISHIKYKDDYKNDELVIKLASEIGIQLQKYIGTSAKTKFTKIDKDN